MKGDIQRIFQQFGDAYIADNRGKLTEQHLKVIHSIQNCGTQALGWIGFQCTECATPHYIQRSCGNRLCPSCQADKTREWLDKRLKEQLPTHYFLITFTVPRELHPFFILRPKQGYTALFNAASKALKTLAGNPRFLGVDLPGFFGALHTWGRIMNYHPHIHFVVPGGGINRAKGIWRCSRKDFYAPGQALAEVCKGIFRDLIDKQGLSDCIVPRVWTRNWVVDAEAIGHNREGAIKYLAPYVFKTAITDSRIQAVTGTSVTFSYVKSGSSRKRKMTLDVYEFIRRYLMHVLPEGFMRIRHYGFMGSGCSVPHKELVALVRMAQAFEVDAIDYVPAEKKHRQCPKCGGPLVAKCIISAEGITLATFLRPYPKRE